MTEDQLVKLLGSPSDRKAPQERVEELAFILQGPPEGLVNATFLGGPLVKIVFSVKSLGSIPTIERSVAEDLAEKRLAMKLIKGELSLEQVCSLAGGPGRLCVWGLVQGNPASQTVVQTQRIWQISGTRNALVLDANDQVPRQPRIVKDKLP